MPRANEIMVQRRTDHVRLAEEAQKRGELLAAGAFEESGTFEGAILVFTDAASAERFAKADPYVANGLGSVPARLRAPSPDREPC